MGLAGDGQEQASCLTGELPLQAGSSHSLDVAQPTAFDPS